METNPINPNQQVSQEGEKPEEQEKPELNEEQKAQMIEQVSKEEIYQQNTLKRFESAIFISYEKEKAFQKLVLLRKCLAEERLTYAKHISELVPAIGVQIFERLPTILKDLVLLLYFINQHKQYQAMGQDQQIHQVLITQIKIIIEYINKNYEDGYKYVKDILKDSLFIILDTNVYEIKRDCGVVVSDVTTYLKHEDVIGMVQDKILQLSQSSFEENKMVAIQIFARIAKFYEEKDKFAEFFEKNIFKLKDDSQIKVRREIILHLGEFSSHLKKELFDKTILQYYINLKQKEHVWGMHKSSVDNLINVANFCTQAQLEQELTKLLLTYLEDSNKWVKIAAFKQLGPFLLKLEKCKINDKLLAYFTKMSDHSTNYLSNDNEIMLNCGQYLPGVLKIQGPSKWQNYFVILQKLAKCKHKKVRIPVACSLHEISKIIGPQLAERDLINIYRLMIYDQFEEVRQSAYKHLADFIATFEQDRRQNLLEFIVQSSKDLKKWRAKNIFASQIDKLALLYNADAVYSYIFPIAVKMCQEDNHSIRKVASQKMYALLKSLYPNKQYREKIIRAIIQFSQSQKYKQRQVFLDMCLRLVKYVDVFKKYFMQYFMNLSEDRVVNVRINFASVIGEIYEKKYVLLEDQDIQQQIQKLSSENELPDVRNAFQIRAYGPPGQRPLQKQNIDQCLAFEEPLVIPSEKQLKLNQKNNSMNLIDFDSPEKNVDIVEQIIEQMQASQVSDRKISESQTSFEENKIDVLTEEFDNTQKPSLDLHNSQTQSNDLDLIFTNTKNIRTGDFISNENEIYDQKKSLNMLPNSYNPSNSSPLKKEDILIQNPSINDQQYQLSQQNKTSNKTPQNENLINFDDSEEDETNFQEKSQQERINVTTIDNNRNPLIQQNPVFSIIKNSSGDVVNQPCLLNQEFQQTFDHMSLANINTDVASGLKNDVNLVQPKIESQVDSPQLDPFNDFEGFTFKPQNNNQNQSNYKQKNDDQLDLL